MDIINKGFWLYGNTYGVICVEDLTIIAISNKKEELQIICDKRNNEHPNNYEIVKLTGEGSHYFTGIY